MATPRDKFESGDLAAAINDLTREVRANPADVQRRTFLFELLLFAGDLDRAERQLSAIGSQSVQAEVGVQAYLNNIRAERAREKLFSNGLAPHFIQEPPAYVDLHLEAVNRVREGDTAEARRLLDRAEEERPALEGSFNGAPFDDFRDYNDIVSPVLEMFVSEKYTWLPLEQIKQIEFDKPGHLRDLLWATARVETWSGTIGQVFLPALYCGSHQHDDDRVKLGRMTDWKQAGDDLYLAAGLRLFWVGGQEKPFHELRSLEFSGSRTA
jgi:type VI secretion system protein ImpE